MIDWHPVDFDNIADPWYEFNRLGIAYPSFASGQIDGYFGGAVPDRFWILLQYYLAASAITSIVWAKYYAARELPSILALNRSILASTDDLRDPIPAWYRRCRQTE